VLLQPDDLGADLEPAGLQAQLHLGGVNARMPDVGDIAGKQLPSGGPVDPIVVGDLATLAGPRVTSGWLRTSSKYWDRESQPPDSVSSTLPVWALNAAQ
jgi:hypothetical protein